MQICRALAGYSYARADLVRRAMSKKKTEAMQAEREAFLLGCRNNGVSDEVAEQIFDEMVGFAKYAFNKSHATVYGVISYRTAYLKAHYPAEYFSALLSSVLDSSSKLKEYIDDAHKYGVNVLPPDVNASLEDFSVSDGGNIRFGLMAIRNVGRQFARAVVNERARSRFKSFDDFVRRLSESDINKRTLESMIKCGVFDSLGVTRRSLLSCYENILESEQGRRRSNLSGQLDLFSIGSSDGEISSASYEYPDIPEFDLKELLILEKESSGMYFSGHMIDSFSDVISNLGCDSISEIKESFAEDNSGSSRYSERQAVTVAGIISSKRTKVTKNGSTMAFITLEDRYAEIDVIAFARQYSQFSGDLSEDDAVLIAGNISYDDDEGVKIILTSVKPLTSDAGEQSHETKTEKRTSVGRLFIRVDSLKDPRIEKIYRIAQLYRGELSVALFDNESKKYSLMKGISISSDATIIERLGNIFGSENVILK